VVFGVVALALHGELAHDRPEPARLTEFYLWTSLGGVVGGVLTALVAPVVFNSLVEYPLALALAAAVAPTDRLGPGPRGGVVAHALVPVAIFAWVGLGLTSLSETSLQLRLALVLAPPAVVAFAFSRRPRAFALALAAFTAGGRLDQGNGPLLEAKRSFFGVHRVVERVDGVTGERCHALLHGSTVHGIQLIDLASKAPIEPRRALSYYGDASGIAAVLSARRPARAGVVGLGAGSLAAFFDAGQSLTFFEIDPLVEQIANDARWFNFVGEARRRGARVDVV